MLKVDQPLHTDRLTVRPFTIDDLDALYDIQSRPDVARYLYWGARTDRDEVRESLTTKIASTTVANDDDALSLAVELTGTGVLVGDLTLFWRSSEHRQAEVGYVFNPDHGGKGYATEGTRVLLRLAFEELGAHRVYGRLDARNTASARVLERLGMRREAHLVQNEIFKGEWSDELVYAMLEDEYRAGTA